MLTHWLNLYIVTKETPDWQHLCKWKQVVDSAGGSFCWNYATDTFCSGYAGDNVCCYYNEPRFQVGLN